MRLVFASPRVLLFLLAALAGSALMGCGGAKPSTLVDSGYDESAMEAAIARARSEVDSFVAELANPTGTDHAVKAPIKDGDQTEHFWMTGLTFENGQFKGTIDNDPGVVTNVKIGQEWSLAKDEISDWMYFREGKMHGNYTVRPLLDGMADEEAEMYRAIFANP